MGFKDRKKTNLANDFIHQVDQSPNTNVIPQESTLNPKAVRKRQLGIKVNAYEYQQLEELAEMLDRSITSTMRYAINKLIKEKMD